MEELLKTATVVLAHLAEICGAIMIGFAVLRALYQFVLNIFRSPIGEAPNEAIRLSLGRALALGLEFLLGADILNTAVAPTWQEVEMLAAVAAIRTGLNYFLQKELERATALSGARQEQVARTKPEVFQDEVSAARSARR